MLAAKPDKTSALLEAVLRTTAENPSSDPLQRVQLLKLASQASSMLRVAHYLRMQAVEAAAAEAAAAAGADAAAADSLPPHADGTGNGDSSRQGGAAGGMQQITRTSRRLERLTPTCVSAAVTIFKVLGAVAELCPVPVPVLAVDLGCIALPHECATAERWVSPAGCYCAAAAAVLLAVAVATILLLRCCVAVALQHGAFCNPCRASLCLVWSCF